MASPSQHLADVQSLLHDAGVAENVIFLKPTRRWRSPAALRSRWKSAGS
jgi:phenylacetic acid degradation operon negative regulatory protein